MFYGEIGVDISREDIKRRERLLLRWDKAIKEYIDKPKLINPFDLWVNVMVERGRFFYEKERDN